MSAARDLLTSLEAALDGVRRIAQSLPLRLGAFAVVALVASWPLLSTAGSLNEFRDAHVLSHYEWAAAESVLRFHQAPLWDPYYCGGMYLLGTPQARFVSPTFVLTLLFGERRGAPIAAFATMLIGLEGTFRYARSRGASASGAMLAAPLFALSGVFAVAPSLGWYNFSSFELLPWIAYATRRALWGRRSAIVAGAALLAWSVGFGGTYTAPMAALYCAFEVVEHMAVGRRSGTFWGHALRCLSRAALMAILALALAAVRLWPIVDTLRAGQRLIGGTPGTAWLPLYKMLFAPLQGSETDGSFYVGYLAIPAAIFGVAQPRARGLLILAVIAFWLGAGYSVQPSLFARLRELPIYSSLRYPERFLIFVALAISVLAASGLTRAERLGSARLPEGVALALQAFFAVTLLASIGPLVGQHVQQAARRELSAPPAAPAAHRPFHQARGNRWALDYYESLDRGSLSCWDAYAVPESARLRGDRREEEYLLEEDAGTIALRQWSPNVIDLDVALTRPATLEVNQNWNAGWRASLGALRSDHGLLAVDLPAGSHSVRLRFEPRSATGGLLVSLTAVGSLVAIAWSGRRRRRQPGRDAWVVAAAIVAPCACFGLCVALMHDAPAAPAEARDINGDPVLADGLPNGAVRLDAQLDVGVTLEAATLSEASPAAGQTLLLELDWKRRPEIARGLGVFMHIEFSKGDAMNGDHILLSSALAFDDAPPNVTLRDVVPLFVPEDAAGKNEKIWVGLWHVRGDGQRARVVDPGHAIVEGGRILAATFDVSPAPSR